MAIVVGVVLAIFSLVIVIFPLVMARSRKGASIGGKVVSPDMLEFQSIREAIQTLRLDYDLGNVTGQHYQEQLQGYRLAAANALRRQGQAAQDAEERLLEQEILKARAALGAVEDGAEVPVEPANSQEPTDEPPEG